MANAPVGKSISLLALTFRRVKTEDSQSPRGGGGGRRGFITWLTTTASQLPRLLRPGRRAARRVFRDFAREGSGCG